MYTKIVIYVKSSDLKKKFGALWLYVDNQEKSKLRKRGNKKEKAGLWAQSIRQEGSQKCIDKIKVIQDSQVALEKEFL